MGKKAGLRCDKNDKLGTKTILKVTMKIKSLLFFYLLLGDHGRSYVVGFGKNPPVRPHHRSSSCKLKSPTTCSWNEFNAEGPNPITLTGALVGGPIQSGSFADERKDYKTNEVAIDYNAGFQTVVAGLISLIDGGEISGK